MSAAPGPISQCEEGGAGTCAGTYGEGEAITLTATLPANFEASWSGVTCTVETATECQLAMPEANAKAEVASEPEAGLQLFQPHTNGGTGTGTLECKDEGGGFEACHSSYLEGHTITLKAEANPHSTFSSLTVSGSSTTTCSGALAECTVEIQSSTVVATAAFTANTHTLTVTTAGSGNVSAETGAISGCETSPAEGTCSGTYDEAATVKLTATPKAHQQFKEWSGPDKGACTTSTVCEVTIPEANAEVTATFEPITHTLTVTTSGLGNVSAETGAISGCETSPAEGTCSGTYDEAATVKLTATPKPHQQFKEWSGPDKGACTTSAVCEVTIPSGNAAVTATFEPITHTLTVTTSGLGNVSAETGAISGCETSPAEGTCSGTYNEASTVKLTATPKAHQQFKEWSGPDKGACTTATTCVVTIPSGNAAVTATFEPKTHTLAITEAGSGTGTVQCDIDGGGFGSCAGPIEEGSEVSVKATADPHNAFTGFSAGTGSAAACSASPCAFDLEADSALTATFDKAFALSVSKTGSGSGTVTSTPAGIDCSSTCSAEFAEGQVVVLDRLADPGSHFLEWTGACTGSGACEVTMSEARSVGAVFEISAHSLTVNKAGSGSGTVSCDGGPCASSYPDGAILTLTASADSGSTFAGWSGSGCTGDLACVVTISADTTVTATFDAEASPPPPPPPAAGTAIAAANARVKGAKALLKLRCAGAGSCKGVVKLYAKLPAGKGKKSKRRRRSKTALIGKASFGIAEGKSKTVKVKISNGQARKLLNRGHVLKARLKGAGIKPRAVKLHPTKAKKRHRHHHHKKRR